MTRDGLMCNRRTYLIIPFTFSALPDVEVAIKFKSYKYLCALHKLRILKVNYTWQLSCCMCDIHLTFCTIENS